jgi:hypothetical protein
MQSIEFKPPVQYDPPLLAEPLTAEQCGHGARNTRKRRAIVFVFAFFRLDP